jgi:hypothetical protein
VVKKELHVLVLLENAFSRIGIGRMDDEIV